MLLTNEYGRIKVKFTCEGRKDFKLKFMIGLVAKEIRLDGILLSMRHAKVTIFD